MQAHTHRITLLVVTTNHDAAAVAHTIESHVDTLGDGIKAARVTTSTLSASANVPEEPTDDGEAIGDWLARYILPLIGIR